jgi:hypothetical protein
MGLIQKRCKNTDFSIIFIITLFRFCFLKKKYIFAPKKTQIELKLALKKTQIRFKFALKKITTMYIDRQIDNELSNWSKEKYLIKYLSNIKSR